MSRVAGRVAAVLTTLGHLTDKWDHLLVSTYVGDTHRLEPLATSHCVDKHVTGDTRVLEPRAWRQAYS